MRLTAVAPVPPGTIGFIYLIPRQNPLRETQARHAIVCRPAASRCSPRMRLYIPSCNWRDLHPFLFHPRRSCPLSESYFSPIVVHLGRRETPVVLSRVG